MMTVPHTNIPVRESIHIRQICMSVCFFFGFQWNMTAISIRTVAVVVGKFQFRFLSQVANDFKECCLTFLFNMEFIEFLQIFVKYLT